MRSLGKRIVWRRSKSEALGAHLWRRPKDQKDFEDDKREEFGRIRLNQTESNLRRAQRKSREKAQNAQKLLLLYDLGVFSPQCLYRAGIKPHQSESNQIKANQTTCLNQIWDSQALVPPEKSNPVKPVKPENAGAAFG